MHVKIDLIYYNPNLKGAQWSQIFTHNGKSSFDGDVQDYPFYYGKDFMQRHIHENSITFFDNPQWSEDGSFRFALYAYKAPNILFSLTYGYDYNNGTVTKIPIQIWRIH